MDNAQILSHVDHTLLTQTATWEDIKKIADEGIEFKTASICIPASYVADAAKYIKEKGSDLAVCTVIGFPNGYATTAAKVFMASDAIKNGASEVDMVINIGWLKDKKYDALTDEIAQIKKAVGDHVLKVIIETCLLTDDEKVKMCEIVGAAGADYIKTSTGFAGGGATFEDVKLFADNVPAGLKIKAAGGIASLDDAEKFLSLGADRLGTSRIVKLVKGLAASGY